MNDTIKLTPDIQETLEKVVQLRRMLPEAERLQRETGRALSNVRDPIILSGSEQDRILLEDMYWTAEKVVVSLACDTSLDIPKPLPDKVVSSGEQAVNIYTIAFQYHAALTRLVRLESTLRNEQKKLGRQWYSFVENLVNLETKKEI